MNLGNIIAEIREKRGLKQKDLADDCNITQAYLSQIENNRKEPNLSTLKTISKVLDIPLPIMFFLSIDKDDLPPQKQTAFEMLHPLIRNLINDFFISDAKA